MAEASVHSKSEDLWTSYKELKTLVWKHLSEESDESSIQELETTLRKYKQNFFSLLQNQPKNAKSREELKKGMGDGINIRGLGHQILSKELYQEAVILSDMFDMNEFIALDLLCTAQIQMSYFPGLPRGLVAVLLYYEGRKSLLLTLRYLVQARSGVQWSLNIKSNVETFITNYTDQLLEGGLFNRIFELLRTLDLSKELEKLQENLALGGPRHRRQVIDLFQEIRIILADIVFTWAVQSGLPKIVVVGLINHLRNTEIEEEASGKLDNVNLYLLMALLASLDLSVLHSREDGEEDVQNLPILCEPNFIDGIISELSANKPKWKNEGMQGVATFGLAVCLASLQLVQNQQLEEAINKGEDFIDFAIHLNVFEFLHNIVLENELIFKETFLHKRIHYLITDFIVYMYPKVKELRIKADEIARTVQIYAREGLEAPTNLPRYFEFFLLAIAKFYSNDKLKTEYVLNYWNAEEPASEEANIQHSSPRSIALFKFLRLAGDKLPSTLFVPYLTMLSSLSTCQKAARHCFNLLKQSPQPTTLSWDHFFSSFGQYYNNLRQETPPIGDTVYRNTFLKGVSPQELEGLHAVLLLMRTIADNDEFSRLALCEHPGWAPLSILLGLVGCAVPIPLKASLLTTLASLSKSSENAAQMWENLEASQILITIPTTSSYTPRGIQTELEEVESRMEEYPLTRGLLTLLDVLTDSGIPRTLGAGPRKPGFDPYLSFIVNSVFLKFHSRSYRSGTEKWQVADLCLKLFEKFLNQYDPQIGDFPKKIGDNEFNSPPGYHLMIQLNNKSEMLNVILSIIEEGNRLFDAYVTSFNGQELVESCTSCCLNIINCVLGLHSKFFSVLTASNATILLTSLAKLLLTINRRTGKPDHCINIAKYISYQPYLLQQGLAAVKILIHITNTPILHSQFMNILLTSDEKNEIKSGFVLSLDGSVEDENEEKLLISNKLEILKLLKQCLLYNSPNLSHYLLGFDLKRDVSRTEFQYSGVVDQPRACLHSLISLVELEVLKNDPSANPLLLESAYEMIYVLVSNGKTYASVLRFLRLCKKFFVYHLNICSSKITKGIHNVNQTSWLLKSLAIELKITSQTKQISYLKQVIHFLLNLPLMEKETNQDPFSSKLNDERPVIRDSYVSLEAINNSFLIQLIPYFDYSGNDVETPSWQFFDAKVLSGRIKSCETSTAAKLIDLKKLHQMLYEELRMLQGTAVMGQIQAISQEIPKILKYALELNRNKENYAAVVQFVDAWRQVVEILTISVPAEIVSHKESQLSGICIVLKLLKKVNKFDLLPEVAQLLSGTILLILSNLRKCHNYEKKQQNVFGTSEVGVLQTHLGSLKEILEALIEWILVSSVTEEKLRINLYASLVILLELASLETIHEDAKLDNSTYISRLDSSRLNLEKSIGSLKLSTDTFVKFGEKLVEVLCQDCIGGIDASKLLALSSFSTLITLSGNYNWIIYMSARGYLKYLIQSILDSNNALQKLLEPNQESIKPLYVYLSKILFFGRLASNRIGAELLLEQKLLSCFGNMSVFNYHPDISRNWRQNDILDSFIPPPEELYLQIWMPTLEICNVILTTLGTENQSAVIQIMHYILNQIEVVELILRSGCPQLNLQSLKELSLLTGLIARTANNNLINILENPDIVQNYRAHLYRIQKLTLALLPKFILTDQIVKELVSNPIDHSHTFQTSERLLYALQIVANLLFYSRNVVANNDVEHCGVGVIFQPTLSDPVLHSFEKNKTFNDQIPSLGVIVQQLITTVNYHCREKSSFDLLKRKLEDITSMDSHELDEFIDESKNLQDINGKREYVYDLISNRFHKKKKELNYANFIIENAIYLIWVHLDYYMLKAIPKLKNVGISPFNNSITGISTLASASEATWKVSTDDISNLKHGLVSIFNDSFSKRLTAAIEDRPDLDKGFIETLLRKIIRLIQFVPVK